MICIYCKNTYKKKEQNKYVMWTCSKNILKEIPEMRLILMPSWLSYKNIKVEKTMLVFKFQLMNMAINLKILMYLSETLSFGYWPKKWIKKDLIKKKHSHIFPDVPNKTCTLSLLKFIGIYLKKKQKITTKHFYKSLTKRTTSYYFFKWLCLLKMFSFD